MLVSFGVHNALAGGTSVFECLCKCMALCMRVCLCCLPAGQAAVGSGYIGQDGVSVCRVLSSLYSNGRLCCFTCCGGWSGVSISPCTSPSLSKTRTQVQPIRITWVSPYVFRPSFRGLEQQACLRGTKAATHQWTFELPIVFALSKYDGKVSYPTVAHYRALKIHTEKITQLVGCCAHCKCCHMLLS